MQGPQHVEGPAAIMQMLQGAQVSATVNTGVQLGVFAKLADGPLDAGAAARAIQCPERSTRVLLDALAVLGLLTKSSDRFALAPVAAQHLVPGKPMYVGRLVDIFCNPMMWGALGRFAEAVKNGGTILPEHAETAQHPFWETFAESSDAMAFPAAMTLEQLLKGTLESKAKVRVLDVAAGSGIYGFTLAKHPNVELTVLDWPNVLDHTRGWAKRLGVDASRVRYSPGNLFEVDWGGPYDVVILSQIYHHFDVPTCEAISRKAAAALAPGGKAAVQDFLYDAELKNPMAALFRITMLSWTRKGQTYTAEEYGDFLTKAGLEAPVVHDSGGLPANWVIAKKR